MLISTDCSVINDFFLHSGVANSIINVSIIKAHLKGKCHHSSGKFTIHSLSQTFSNTSAQ